MYERFEQRLQCVPAETPVHLAFHGTSEENIEAICMQGLDPARRGANGWLLFGTGEYFHMQAKLADLHCSQHAEHGRMLIFAVIVDRHSAQMTRSGVIRVTDPTQHVPLAVLWYERSSSSECDSTWSDAFLAPLRT